jgi:hypothetical protein
MTKSCKISSSPSLPSPPLTRRVPEPSKPPYPTCQPLGCTLPLSPRPRSGQRPRQPTSASTPSLCPPNQTSERISPSAPRVFPGEPAPSPVHHRRQATPNLLQACHPGHAPKTYPTPFPSNSRSRTRALHLPSTLLAQTLASSRPLDHLGHCQAPARTDVTARSAHPSRRPWTPTSLQNVCTAHARTPPCDDTALPSQSPLRTPHHHRKHLGRSLPR